MFDVVPTKGKNESIDTSNPSIKEISIEDFMKDVLPTSQGVEVYLENRLEKNFVNLITSKDPEKAKPMFGWGNPYSWTYSNNLSGVSMIKQAVKSQGGKVDGVLRFSIMWSEGGSNDNSDLDAHCKEPDGNMIFYKRSHSAKTGGNLDIDITDPGYHKRRGKEVVENITYPNLEDMENGIYWLKINQFSGKNSQGFKAEVEFNGELYSYSSAAPVRGTITVAKVTLKDGLFSIEHGEYNVESLDVSKDIYSLATLKFHPVNLMCLSPNYWGNNKSGNKHYFFMLDGAKTDKSLRSFHSEYLNSDLKEARKTLERFGSVNLLSPENDQLAGVGFNSTVRDNVIVRLKGSKNRLLKVLF